MELDFQKDPSILGRVVDAVGAGFFTVDAQGQFVAWSAGAERITGYSSAEVAGQPCTMLEGQNCKGFASLKELMATPENCPQDGVCSQECRLLSKDGRELYIHGNVRMLFDHDNILQGAVGCFTDLTEFVLANEKISLLQEQTRQRDAFERMTGNSNVMQEVFRKLRLAAQSEVTVFVSGESGTGKELAASAIHSVSDRRDHPFIAVNCSAIPESLLESELFGHVKGAFTGATRDKPGLFQAAEGGTLFLDEIGDVSPLIQLKLLRVLQQREIRRVGDDQAVPVNVRVVTATNRNLQQLIQQGHFREDFYYRIHVFEVHLPPLRERKDDIPLLVDCFIRELAAAQNSPVSGIARDALQVLMNYAWPGNVRELRNSIEHAFVTVADDTITLFDLPLEIRKPQQHKTTTDSQTITSPQTSPQADDAALTAHQQQPTPQFTPKQLAEKAALEKLLRQTGGNKTEAARRLGVSRVTMWKKTSRYGL